MQLDKRYLTVSTDCNISSIFNFPKKNLSDNSDFMSADVSVISSKSVALRLYISRKILAHCVVLKPFSVSRRSACSYVSEYMSVTAVRPILRNYRFQSLPAQYSQLSHGSLQRPRRS